MKTEKRPIVEVQNREGMNRRKAQADDWEINKNNDMPSTERGSLANHSKKQWSKPRSYANAVATGAKSMGKREKSKEKTSGINNTWVGRLQKLDIFGRLEDKRMWEAGQEIRPTYMGEDMVLMVGLTNSGVEEICINEDDNGMSLFHSLEKWNLGMRPGHKLVWLECWGAVSYTHLTLPTICSV